MDRKSGILLPLFSLPGEYGCGTFGEEAIRWIQDLRRGGFSVWQVLPFGITDEYASPYMSLSSFGGNPFFIDPSELFRNGWVTEEELEEQKVADPYLCDWTFLRKKRLPFLKRAAARVTDKSAILSFFKSNPILDSVCHFLAKQEKNNGLPFREWTKEATAEEVFSWQFIQYEFHRQWKTVRRAAEQCGVKIIGDLPFYVSENSFDVYANPDAFQLDVSGRPTSVAGVPPDYFSPQGQLWGNPLYDWDHMEQTGFRYWLDRLAYQLTLFDGIRLDHFRAISAYWSVPSGAKTAKEGRWVKGPGKKFLAAMKPITNGKMILAEDLGIIDDDTQKLLQESGLPGMSVFQFGFDGNPKSPHLPHNYHENRVAYTGTHDNNTLLGFWMELDEATRAQALDYLGNPGDGCRAAIRALFMSRAGLVVFPAQDLLGYGADTRINTPGTAEGNWRFRLSKAQIESIDWEGFAHMNRIYARN